MHVKVTLPGRGNDPRNTVTFTDDGLPLPLSLHFLRVGDTTTDEIELRVIGLELGARPAEDQQALAMPELTALTLRRLVERYPHWVELARSHLGVADLNLAVGVKRAKPARLDPEWFQMIAGEYLRHVDDGEPAPVSVIAKAHGVTVSAASRWVKTARERGLLVAPEARR